MDAGHTGVECETYECIANGVSDVWEDYILGELKQKQDLLRRQSIVINLRVTINLIFVPSLAIDYKTPMTSRNLLNSVSPTGC